MGLPFVCSHFHTSCMKKLLESFGLMDPEPPVLKPVNRTLQYNDFDMEAFSKWCKELNVSILARNPEFTVTIGNHVKHVTLDRF